jgi:hypothetical protein
MTRAEKRKYHYIYKITCKITNRFYIGMHSTDNLNDGYMGSGKRLWFSINYHGRENHIKEILEFLPSRQALIEREEEIVTKDLINEKLCLNLVKGGQGGGGCSNFDEEKLKKFTNDGVKARIEKFNNDSEYRAAVIKTASETLKKCWAEGKLNDNKRFTGLTHSEETKNLLSKLKQGTGLGETNSQYGTCWITKEGVNKKIKKEDLDTFIQDGWVKGRK